MQIDWMLYLHMKKAIYKMVDKKIMAKTVADALLLERVTAFEPTALLAERVQNISI